MKRKSLIFCVIILMLIASGCGESGMDCFMSTGKIIRQERSIVSFDSIEINDNVDVFLIKDTMYHITVEAGQNLLNGITTEVANKQLVIRNMNTCNWVRSYKKPINIYVSYRNLWKIDYKSSGNITTLNTIIQDSLLVEIWGGCGEVKLDVNLNDGFFKLYLGTADMLLSGTCDIVSFLSCDFGLLDAANMTACYAFITSKSSNNCYVKATQELQATIESIGNIYYTGNPQKVITTINGEGSVIPF